MESSGNPTGQVTQAATWRTKETRREAHLVNWAETVAKDPDMAKLFPPTDPEFLRRSRATGLRKLIPLPLPDFIVIPEFSKTRAFNGVRPHNPRPESVAHRARNRFNLLVPATARPVQFGTIRRVRFRDIPTPVALSTRSSNPFKDILMPPKVTGNSTRAESISGASIASQSTTQPTIDDLKQMSKDIQDSLDRMIAKNIEELARSRAAT